MTRWTGLANRRELLVRLEQACISGAASASPLTLMILDLDNFKGINDALGHRAGDQLLFELSVRLRYAARAPATVARLGGDEFAVLVPGMDRAGGERLVGRICDGIERDFELQGMRLSVRASIGIAICPEHGSDPRRSDPARGCRDVLRQGSRIQAQSICDL